VQKQGHHAISLGLFKIVSNPSALTVVNQVMLKRDITELASSNPQKLQRYDQVIAAPNANSSSSKNE
jgi:putative NADH-flavin reductase